MSGLARKLGVVLAGIAVLLLVGAAAPVALAALAVVVWPHVWTWQAIGPGRAGVLVADGIAWVAWAVYLAGLAADVVARVRHRDQPAPMISGIRGRLAGWVAGLVLVLLPAAMLAGSTAGAASLVPRVSIAAPAPAAPAATVASMVTLVSTATSTVANPSAISDPGSAAATSPAVATYTVVAGDCLSTIAERLYGDEGAWTEIWTANADELMADGTRFTDPNLIRPGWVLTLPGVPAAPAAATPSPTMEPSGASAPTGTSLTTPRTAPAPPTAPTSPAVSTHAASSAAVTPTTDGPPAPDTAKTGSAPTRPMTARAATGSLLARRPDPAPVSDPLVRWVPEAAALGVSAVVAAALVRRMRRGRARARAARGDGEVVVEPSEAAIAIESRAAPLADATVLDWLELANRHLMEALRTEGTATEAPDVRMVRVGPGGVELLLDARVDWSPGAFVVADDGHTWLLPPAVDREALWATASGHIAWLPLLVPVGDDPSGTYLLYLAPGTAVSVEGPEAEAMLRAWVAAVRAWPWAEQVPVAVDPEAADQLVWQYGGQVTVDERGTVLFVGDPAALSPRARETVATATGDRLETETRVVVTATRAIIEPLGIAVRPCTLGTEEAQALDGVLDGESLIPASDVIVEPGRRSSELAEGVGCELMAPGPIEVRLLTFTPELVGLAQPLPNTTMLRVTELVAWLALRGERGSTAASMVDHGICGATTEKTIYNMVSAARAVLGTDAAGADRLLLDRSTGIYRVSGDLTVDVVRFEAMATAGVAAVEPEYAATLCQAALALIEDTPVGNGHGRFGWWSGTWAAQLGRLATKAAARLAELAKEGVVDLETARWGIERARLAADVEEELHRVAMELEDWAGDHMRVEREWESVCGQAEDLSSGSAPTEMTEALYGAIRRRWRHEGSIGGR